MWSKGSNQINVSILDRFLLVFSIVQIDEIAFNEASPVEMFAKLNIITSCIWLVTINQSLIIQANISIKAKETTRHCFGGNFLSRLRGVNKSFHNGYQ